MPLPVQLPRRRLFNMIEVVLALIVVAIGMMAIVGLIPIGTKATRDAIGDSYAADTADHLLHQLAQNARSNWATYITPITDDANLPSLAGAVGPIDDGNWSPITDSLYYSTTYVAGKIVYRVCQKRISAYDGEKRETIDFDAIVRIWKLPVLQSTYDPMSNSWNANSSIDANKSVRLYIEMSWPATVDFEDRHLAYYTMEVAQ